MKDCSANNTMGLTRWWGQPALPDGVNMPYFIERFSDEENPFESPMTLICQINCADFKRTHPNNPTAELLPDKGAIAFFAYLDYFFGNLNADSPGIHLGAWEEHTYRVIFSPDLTDLRLHTIIDENEEECSLPAEAEEVPLTHHEESRMLEHPTIYYDEIEQEYPGYLTLVQLDESDRHHLRFYDCGCLFFLIKPDDLIALRFDRVKCVLYCM